MCAALPRPDYYGDSAPRPRPRETWSLAAVRCRGARFEVPVFKGGTRGAVGGWLYPCQRGPPSSSGPEDSASIPGAPSSHVNTARLRLQARRRRGHCSFRGFHHQLHRGGHSPAVIHHGICGSPPRANPRGHFRPLGCCRPFVQSRTTFAAPFCTRPDPGEDDVFRSSVPPSLHGTPTSQW